MKIRVVMVRILIRVFHWIAPWVEIRQVQAEQAGSAVVDPAVAERIAEVTVPKEAESIEELVKPKRTRKAISVYLSEDVHSALGLYAEEMNMYSRGKPNVSMAMEVSLRQFFGMGPKKKDEDVA